MKDEVQRSSQKKSFRTILLLEAWERFGYYGMASLLVLYLLQRAGFDDARANLTWGAFAALVYAAPVIGGWIGDKLLGPRRTVTLGAIVLASGYFLLALPVQNQGFMYYSMAFVIVGNGLFKANAANIVRRIFESEDAKIDSAFTLYYLAINVGATVAMVLAPWIQREYGWHAAFGVCSIGLFLGLLNYVTMRKALLDIGSLTDKRPIPPLVGFCFLFGAVIATIGFAEVLENQSLARMCICLAAVVTLAIFAYTIFTCSKGERAGLIACLLLTAQAILFFVFYQQMSTSLTLFALRNVDWNQTVLGLTLFTWAPAQYQALNPIWIMVLSPLLAWTYVKFGRSDADLPIAGKFSIGFLVVAIGFFMFGSSAYWAINGKVSSWLMIGGYGLISLGELLVSALGLAVIARYAPAKMGGFMMGAFMLVIGISQYLGSVVANYAQVPGDIVEPRVSLEIYTAFFNKIGVAALFGFFLALALLPVHKRLSALHFREKAARPFSRP